MASVPADHTRYRALRRHAAEVQRRADAAVPGAVQAGQLPRMAAVLDDQGPPHVQHRDAARAPALSASLPIVGMTAVRTTMPGCPKLALGF